MLAVLVAERSTYGSDDDDPAGASTAQTGGEYTVATRGHGTSCSHTSNRNKRNDKVSCIYQHAAMVGVKTNEVKGNRGRTSMLATWKHQSSAILF